MPPPSKASDTSGVFLRRTRHIALHGGRICGTAWLMFMCWIAWTQPDRLGPTRMLSIIALGSVTSVCIVLWWWSTLRIKERLDASLNAVGDSTANALTPTANGHRTHLTEVRR